jgi:hypothetical protein
VFGFAWGLAAALAASVAASLAAFLVGRYVIHDRIGRAARRDPSFAAVDAAVARDPFKVVALLRLSPVFPSALKSYFLGLTRIDAVAYTTASALGMLPGLAVKVYLGDAGRGALAGGGTESVDAQPPRELCDPGPEGVVLPQRPQLLVDAREDLLEDVLCVVLREAEGLDANRVDVARETVDQLPPGVFVTRAAARYELGVGSLGAQWV